MAAKAFKVPSWARDCGIAGADTALAEHGQKKRMAVATTDKYLSIHDPVA
jgi:hypothetical protein